MLKERIYKIKSEKDILNSREILVFIFKQSRINLGTFLRKKIKLLNMIFIFYHFLPHVCITQLFVSVKI